MIRHIVMWDYAEDYTLEQNRENAIKIKSGLEDMHYAIAGVLSIRVIIDPLPSSSAAILLDSLFADKAALDAYWNHPAHARLLAFIAECTENERRVDFVEYHA